MVKYCPLCKRLGCNKQIKAVQINYEEALLMCESDTCVWPFGYENFQFIPQLIDCSDGNNKKTHEQKSPKLPQNISTDLSMYTPPVTPSGEKSSKDIKIDSTSDSYASTATNDDIFIISSSLNTTMVPNVHKKKLKNEKNYLLNEDISLVTSRNKPTIIQNILDTNSSMPLSSSKLNHSSNNCNGNEEFGIRYVDTRPSKNNKTIKKNLSGAQSTKVVNDVNENLTSNIDKCKIQMSKKIISFQNLKNKNSLGSNGLSDCGELNNSGHSKQNLIDILLGNGEVDDNNEISVQQVQMNLTNNDSDTAKNTVDNGEVIYEISENGLSKCVSTEQNNDAEVHLNNLLDEILLDDCMDTTTNIDDEWLKSFLT